MTGTGNGRRPRVILITGEPGSGKSTLGRELACALRVPFLARDDVRGGLFFTAGAWGSQPQPVPPSTEAVEAFLELVTAAARLGVSCVAELVVRRNRPRDLERIVAVAECVVLVTWCRNPIERFARRAGTDELLNRPEVLEVLGFADVQEHTTAAIPRMQAVAHDMRRDFDLPCLRVNTDDGYDPEIGDIIDFVTT